MTFDEFATAMEAAVPGCAIEELGSGELVVYTGLCVDNGVVRLMTQSEINEEDDDEELGRPVEQVATKAGLL